MLNQVVYHDDKIPAQNVVGVCNMFLGYDDNRVLVPVSDVSQIHTSKNSLCYHLTLEKHNYRLKSLTYET